ncbi:MAG: hypothetical protein GYB68_01520 [Chloroflexi bacterium]|nr:hypothetical protein [Chloroflexota bacterium]
MFLEQEILDHLRRLSDAQRQRVLDYIRTLEPERPQGTPAHVLKGFVGHIPDEELDRMERAIDDDLGQVNPDAW